MGMEMGSECESIQRGRWAASPTFGKVSVQELMCKIKVWKTERELAQHLGGEEEKLPGRQLIGLGVWSTRKKADLEAVSRDGGQWSNKLWCGSQASGLSGLVLLLPVLL